MKIIDLSAEIYSNMPIYPGDPAVKIEKTQAIDQIGWEVRSIQMGTHTGTHVDAFSHMHLGHLSIDKIALHRFFGPAQHVTADSRLWPYKKGLLFSVLMDIDRLQELLEVQPNFVGGAITEALERALLKEGIITYTDLVNLDQVPIQQTFMFYGFPLKIKEGDASPVRAVAVFEDEAN